LKLVWAKSLRAPISKIANTEKKKDWWNGSSSKYEALSSNQKKDEEMKRVRAPSFYNN
jgi:L-rhamnose mutarotase